MSRAARAAAAAISSASPAPKTVTHAPHTAPACARRASVGGRRPKRSTTPARRRWAGEAPSMSTGVAARAATPAGTARGRKVAYQSTPGPASIMARRASTCGRRAVGAEGERAGWKKKKGGRKKKSERVWSGETGRGVWWRRLLSTQCTPERTQMPGLRYDRVRCGMRGRGRAAGRAVAVPQSAVAQTRGQCARPAPRPWAPRRRPVRLLQRTGSLSAQACRVQLDGFLVGGHGELRVVLNARPRKKNKKRGARSGTGQAAAGISLARRSPLAAALANGVARPLKADQAPLGGLCGGVGGKGGGLGVFGARSKGGGEPSFSLARRRRGSLLL